MPRKKSQSQSDPIRLLQYQIEYYKGLEKTYDANLAELIERIDILIQQRDKLVKDYHEAPAKIRALESELERRVAEEARAMLKGQRPGSARKGTKLSKQEKRGKLLQQLAELEAELGIDE